MAQFNEYVADGVTRLFAYRFPAFETSDIQVSLDGVAQSSGWSPLGLGGGNGGAVEFTSAPATGVVVRIARVNIPPQIAYLVRDENLADVQDKAQARTNLGVYSTTQTDAAIAAAADAVEGSSLQKSANLSDVADAGLARANLGVYSTTQTDAAIAAAADAVEGSSLQKAANLSDVADAGLARTNLGAAASSHTHAADDITSGTIATARLGSGTADSATFLRGDGEWATPPSTGGLAYVSTTNLSGTSVTISGLESGYDYVFVGEKVKSDRGGYSDFLQLRMNNDSTTANYVTLLAEIYASSVVGASGPYTGAFYIGQAHYTATSAASFEVTLYDAGGSGIKHAKIAHAGMNNNQERTVSYGGGYWSGTAAVTSVTLFGQYGGTLSGTVTLYRRKRST